MKCLLYALIAVLMVTGSLSERVAVIMDDPLIAGDGTPNMFGILAKEGCYRAANEILGAGKDTIEPWTHVIGVGFAFDGKVQVVAKDYLNVTFGVVDFGIWDPLDVNVQGLIFAEDEAAYAAGNIAGLFTKTGVTCVIAGMPFPPLQKFLNGFLDGVMETCPDCDTLGRYAPSFVDGVLGRSIADEMIADGCDVLFGAAGSLGSAAILHAASHKIYVIGVDSDEKITTFKGNPNVTYLVSSAMKAVDIAVYKTLEDVFPGGVGFQGGNKLIDASVDGVKMAPCSSEMTCADFEIRDALKVDLDEDTGCSTFEFRTRAVRRDELFLDLKNGLKFSGTDNSGFLLKRNPPNDEWSYIETLGLKPSSRQSHSAAVSTQNQIFYFGGETLQGPVDDFFMLDYDKNEWFRIKEPNGPTKRHQHTAVMVNDVMYIFGGRVSASDQLNDIYTYDPAANASMRWTLLAQGGTIPSARSQHAAVAVGTNFYVYGGVDTGLALLQDFWRFDTISNTWELLTETGPPELRNAALLSINSTIYLYGGESVSIVSNQLWSFDTTTGSGWVEVLPEGPKPPAVSKARMFQLDNRRLLIAGGQLEKGLSNEAFIYNWALNRWVYEESADLPLAMHSMAVVNFNQDQKENVCAYEVDFLSFIQLCQHRNELMIIIHGGFTEDGLKDDTIIYYAREELPEEEIPGPGLSTAVKGIIGAAAAVFVILVALLILWYMRKQRYELELLNMRWKINYDDLDFVAGKGGASRQFRSRSSVKSGVSDSSDKQVFAKVAKWKGNMVAVKIIGSQPVDLSRELMVLLKLLMDSTHSNVNQFMGCCVDVPNICSVSAYGNRGSLQDIIGNPHYTLDSLFKFSMAYDCAFGMAYLHATFPSGHGRLKSTNCVVDSRWTLKIADFGIEALMAGQGDPELSEYVLFTRFLWTSPELMPSNEHILANKHISGTQSGDVYSFGVILKELVSIDMPFAEIEKEPKELIEAIRSQGLKPTIPTDSTQCLPELKTLIERCWNKDPTARPQFSEIASEIKRINPEKSLNLIDSMVKILEKYANHLESLVEERTQELEVEKKKTEELLYRMLPREVAESLKIGQKVDAETFTESSIYFSDIVGFTNIAGGSTPLQVVELLNDLYTCFDAIIDNHDVYKVETIGDAYMVVSGVPLRNGNRHAGEICTMALDLLAAMAPFKIRHMPGKQLQLRAGVHSGPVVAGVVGLKMPRYCLFGDTVNTASRMESGGMALRIHLSEMCADVLMALGGYHLESRGEIEVKGKGSMTTYWLNGKDGFDKVLPDLSKAASKDEHTFK